MRPLRTSAAVLLLGAASAGTLAVTSAAAASGPVTETIKNFAYSPHRLVISRGTTVVFANRDITNHSVTADRGSFDISNLASGHSIRMRFTHSGTFSYHCTFHPYMHGTIVVR